jgi:negative regulator of flagellin synthesis FlgM
MNIQNNLQGLQQLFSSQDVTPAAGKTGGSQAPEAKVSSDQATLSSLASAASAVAPDSDVRMEKVAAIQQAVASGTYSVPSSEVAGRMIDHMLGK